MSDDNTDQLQQQIEHLQQQLTELKQAKSSPDNADASKVTHKMVWLETLFHNLNAQVQGNKQLYVLYVPLVHLVGYALLGLAFIDYINLFIPSHFTNPYWELQLIASVVDHVPLPLVGIMLVFYGHRFRGRIEKVVMRILAWAALIAGILYLLLIPLGTVDSYRVNTAYNIEVTEQLNRQTFPLQNLRKKVTAAQSTTELLSLVNSENAQAPPLKISNPEQFKQTILDNIDKASAQAKKQSDAQLKQRQKSLLQDAIRYLLGCLICGAFFISIGRLALRLVP